MKFIGIQKNISILSKVLMIILKVLILKFFNIFSKKLKFSKDHSQNQKKNSQPKQLDLNQINFCFNFGSFKRNIPLDSGEQLDVYLCEPILSNDIYVNLECLKGSLQQFSSIINVYCNNQSLNYHSLEALKNDSVFFAFYLNVWHRVKFISYLQNGSGK